MLKTIVITLIIGIFLSLIVLLNPVLRMQYRFLALFNKITIQNAIQLAVNCQVKTTSKPHTEGIIITLTDGSSKYLEDKYEVINHYSVYDQNYNQFFKLLSNSKTSCGFQVQSYIE